MTNNNLAPTCLSPALAAAAQQLPLTAAEAAAIQRRHRRFWTAIILGFLSIDFSMAIAAIILSHNAQAAAVIPDYYQKSLEWDARKAEAARNASTRSEAVIGEAATSKAITGDEAPSSDAQPSNPGIEK